MPNRIFWTRQAREDLREVRAFIARDAPATATAFVRRLRQSVERLRVFPCSGQIVPELGREDIRELLKGNYRVIYRVAEHRVEILTVYHSARLLDESDFRHRIMTTNMPCLPGPDARHCLTFTHAWLALLMKCTCPREALGEVTSASAALTKGDLSCQLVNRLRIFGLIIKPPIVARWTHASTEV